MKPRPSIYIPDFIAANQKDRADNCLSGTKWELVEKLREDIRDFKKKQNLDKVIIIFFYQVEDLCFFDLWYFLNFMEGHFHNIRSHL